MSLTAPRNTREAIGDTISVTANASIYAGAMVALNASGHAVPAAVSSGYTVVGRAENTVTSGGILTVRRGAFLYDNYTSAAVSASDIGKTVYVHDDASVQAFNATSGAVNIAAGKLLGFAEGQAIVEIR